MKRILIAATAGLLLAGPALAQADQAPKPVKKPQMCEMMHDGGKMKGMMVRGEDGKMTCRMMDHSQMDHSQMDPSQMDPSQMHHGTMEHGKMGHSQMNHGTMDHSAAPDGQTPPAPAAEAAADHDAHAGHDPE